MAEERPWMKSTSHRITDDETVQFREEQEEWDNSVSDSDRVFFYDQIATTIGPPIKPKVRSLDVVGQQEGGPIILMGVDPEQKPNSDNHGPPEEHAAMVASMLENVTNGNDGIIVLGAADNGDDVVRYWRGDVGNDPQVDEQVTFVAGADNIRNVDFTDYALIGIPSSNNQINGGYALTRSENRALIDRQFDIAMFVNEGGGLLGMTQQGFSASESWEYISPLADISASDDSYENVAVTDAGKALGLTQSGMDGWCCYHERLHENSIPDFLDVLIRKGSSTGPPAAIGGHDVIIEPAVRVESTGPTAVEAEVTVHDYITLDNALNNHERNVDLLFRVTRDGGIHEGDITLSDGTATADSGALTSVITDEPITLTSGVSEDFTTGISFNAHDTYHVEIDVLDADTGEVPARLPFDVTSIDRRKMGE